MSARRAINRASKRNASRLPNCPTCGSGEHFACAVCGSCLPAVQVRIPGFRLRNSRPASGATNFGRADRQTCGSACRQKLYRRRIAAQEEGRP